MDKLNNAMPCWFADKGEERGERAQRSHTGRAYQSQPMHESHFPRLDKFRQKGRPGSAGGRQGHFGKPTMSTSATAQPMKQRLDKL
ncbi:hypothetical protein TEQG_08569 [Trichophyton equinum CBS 127.97]|uniref:Uncharacterized protein n=1 Tax=Trichophyton equinum (strain ATCC MYA-4606 / CBS 127.97) TaxID=559882 RepID=F2PHH7_TRIEC|nr:hypothetical protein TEQG_08569 [Trichophyton equinum CBS 127.97]